MDQPRTYTTSRIASAVGIHPNTVRLYERIGFITAPERLANGYRVFTDLHLLQVRLVRAALNVELVQNGLRREVLAIVETMASQRYDEAISLARQRIDHLRRERCAAEDALRHVRDLLSRSDGSARAERLMLTRKEAADQLDTTIDALRNWEMNGLLQVKRKQNGYRVYSAADLDRLAIIRALRAANYSLAAILRLLDALDRDATADIGHVLDHPDPDDDILSVCDRLLTSLDAAERNAFEMIELLERMKNSPEQTLHFATRVGASSSIFGDRKIGGRMNDVVHVRDLVKTYGGVPAVDGIGFDVAIGETFGLLGANGAGKTTTLECLLGVSRPDAGSATILGLDPRTRRKELFQRVGVQFQEARYQDKITVDELCRATRALYREADDPAKLLARFSLTEVRKQAVESLSGGQRQRLFVVLALIPRPEVVFLDELTTGLDVKARRDVWNLLDEMRQQGMTIVLTSHFMDEVEALCDRVIILRKGRIVFEGTVAEAVASGPFASFEDAYLAYAEPAEHAESVEAAEPAATAHFSEGGAHESL